MNESAENTASMLRLFGQMARFPLDVFVLGVGLFLRSFRGLQESVNQGDNAMPRGSGPDRLMSPRRGGEDMAFSSWTRPTGPNKTVSNISSSSTTRETTMGDQDLSGDDLKYVSYSILFTKRDFEQTLESKREDLVNYSTNGGSFGGLKIANFFKEVEEGRVRRPQLWAEKDYPPNARSETDWRIPEEDKKYVTFIYCVDRRLPKQDTEYDKLKVEVLREIAKKIG